MSAADANMPLRVFCESVTRGALSAIWGVKTTGLELIPREGRLIVACNHVSIVDPPLLYSALGLVRRPYGLGKKELFEIPILGRFFRATGNIPLDRRGDVVAMREALEVLEREGTLAIFPEGTRVKPGETRVPKPGVGFLSARTKSRVIPARVLRTAEFPRSFPLEVRFGAPLDPPSSDDRATSLAFARRVMDAINAL